MTNPPTSYTTSWDTTRRAANGEALVGKYAMDARA